VGMRQAGIDRDGRFRMAHDAFRLAHSGHLPLACAACSIQSAAAGDGAKGLTWATFAR
jgi:hypothetical protein